MVKKIVFLAVIFWAGCQYSCGNGLIRSCYDACLQNGGVKQVILPSQTNGQVICECAGR